MRTDRVLVVNAGSSSLKLRLLAGQEVVRGADLAVDGDPAAAVRDWPTPDVGGHRIVDGGTEFRGAVRAIPGNHSPLYAPVIEPTLSIGTAALVHAAREWLDGSVA